MTPIYLKTPLRKKDIDLLKAGDVVMITGTLFTTRSQFHIHFIDNGHIPPFDPRKNNVMLHSGPLVEKVGDGWQVRAMSVTTSIRFDKWEPEAIRRLGLRAIIGKGKVGDGTRAALRKYGCVHLGKTGIFGGPLAAKVEAVENVHWMELGLPEATWILRIKDFGPFIVTADTKGNCLFDGVSSHVNEQMTAIYRKLGIEAFEFEEK